MNRLLSLCAVSLIGLFGCKAKTNAPSEAGLRDAIRSAHELFQGEDPEAVADLYVTRPGQNREDNLRFAKSMLNANLPADYKLHGCRIAGNMGVALISRPEDHNASPLFARWTDGRWQFFRQLVLWGNTNRVEQFGLSEQEMQDALELQRWVSARKTNDEQIDADQPATAPPSKSADH